MKHLFLIIIIGWPTSAAAEVLIVTDERPAMEVFAKELKHQENISSKIVGQVEMPQSLAGFEAVIVYIHKQLSRESEKAFINYTKRGGKLISLHHSISSGKKTNEWWHPFLGVDLKNADVNHGGYTWIDGVNIQIVNLAPDHFITTNKVKYSLQVPYTREAGGKEELLPAFTVSNTEVYLNHLLLSPRTILLGFKYEDAAGNAWMQDRSAWCMPADKGWLFYSQVGHTPEDFKNPAYTRIIINAIIFKH